MDTLLNLLVRVAATYIEHTTALNILRIRISEIRILPALSINLSPSIEIGVGIDLLMAKLVDDTSDLHLQQVPLFLF